MTTPRGRAPQGRTMTPRLPRSATARLARFENATAHPSFLSVPAAYGVRTSGFEPVGDVMGCLAFQTSTEYLGRCGARSRTPAVPGVTFASSSGSTATSYLRQLGSAYRTALERLRAEAVALDADGVVGIVLTLEVHDEVREVTALGSAVRSSGRVRPARLFTTDLPGTDVVALLIGGWVPVELHVAVALGLRHIDQGTMYEASPLRSNTNREVSGYTELRQRLTERVRNDLRSRITKSGADGALLSELRLRHWHRHCASVGNSSDLVGLATATGTSIARFAAPSKAMPAPLTVLSVGRGPR